MPLIMSEIPRINWSRLCHKSTAPWPNDSMISEINKSQSWIEWKITITIYWMLNLVWHNKILLLRLNINSTMVTSNSNFLIVSYRPSKSTWSANRILKKSMMTRMTVLSAQRTLIICNQINFWEKKIVNLNNKILSFMKNSKSLIGGSVCMRMASII